MKFTKFLLPFSIFAGAVVADNAAFITSLYTLESDARATDASVNRFYAANGLAAALQIQSGALKFSRDLSAALAAGQGVDSTASTQVAGIFTQLGTATVQLLNDLSRKAGDFAQVGTTTIVQSDLTDLQSKANQLVAVISRAVKCGPDGDSARSVVSNIDRGFASANAAFNNRNQPAPAVSCVR